MKTRVLAYAAGVAFIAYGLRGIVTGVPAGAWAAWFAGAAILHDGVLVPAVLAAGLLTGFLPAAHRRTVRAGLVVAACVTAVAIPLVLGYGRRADEPSRLPLPYDRNLAIVLGFITAATVCAAAARAVVVRRKGRSGGATRAPARPSRKERGR